MSCRIVVRHTRKTSWLTIISVASSLLLATNSQGASLSLNASAPSGNILASQLGDVGPGTGDGNRDYVDNGGPPGQTFKVTSNGMANRFTLKGRGDSSDAWNGGVNGWEGDEVWGIQVSSVNAATGALTPIATENATGFTAGGATGISDYLTLTLASPVALSTGTTYAFSVYLSATDPGNAGAAGTDGGWFGIAHTTADVYADGAAINDNNSIANPGGNTGANRRNFPVAGFAAPIPANYDFVFAVQGIPEPSTMALTTGLLGLAPLRRLRFRRGAPV